jgi:hypothetical protein
VVLQLTTDDTFDGEVVRLLESRVGTVIQQFELLLGHGPWQTDPTLIHPTLIHLDRKRFSLAPKLGPAVIYSRTLPFDNPKSAVHSFEAQRRHDLSAGVHDSVGEGLLWQLVGDVTNGQHRKSRVSAVQDSFAQLPPDDKLLFAEGLRSVIARLNLAIEYRAAISDVVDVEVYYPLWAILQGKKFTLRVMSGEVQFEWQDAMYETSSLVPIVLHGYIGSERVKLDIVQEGRLADDTRQLGPPNAEIGLRMSSDLIRLIWGSTDTHWDAARQLGWSWLSAQAIVESDRKYTELLLIACVPPSFTSDEIANVFCRGVYNDHPGGQILKLEAIDTHIARPAAHNPDVYPLEAIWDGSVEEFLNVIGF